MGVDVALKQPLAVITSESSRPTTSAAASTISATALSPAIANW